jgi:hypothetical protein
LALQKDAAYNALMEEFDLTLTQVRNKIRIYRTTYSQETKKMEANKEYVPRLSWFPILHNAFSQGKAKSFVKTPKRGKIEAKSEIEIEFQEGSEEEMDNGNETQYEIKKVSKIENTSGHQHIIIEPYEDDYEMDDSLNIQSTPTVNTTKATSSSEVTFGMQSNELFLKSLQSTLDKLPDDKNMRARIKIQEILYQIAYDK